MFYFNDLIKFLQQKMVSEKTIVILLVVAIVLSLIAIALTMSLNIEQITSMFSGNNAVSTGGTSSSAGQVQLVVTKPAVS
jgi:flagellar basal body-associated protein FliL